MIVIDSSAFVAIALQEPEATRFISAIRADDAPRLSAANYVEASIVLEGRLGAIGRSVFDSVVDRLTALGVDFVAFDEMQGELAREGFRRFGKGRHPAALNFGDCFAYALAKALDAPLLYKGTDFAKTDVATV